MVSFFGRSGAWRIFPLAGLCLLLAAATVSGQTTANAGGSGIDPDQVAAQAFQHLKARDYARAERLFLWIRDSFPESPRVVEALLGLAEVEAAKGRTEPARDLFSAFLLNFPDHPLAPRARFKLGNIERAMEAATAEKAHSSRQIEPLIGAQVLVVGASHPDEVDRMFSGLAAAGLNTILVRVFHNAGDRYHGLVPEKWRDGRTGVYFQTRHAPVVTDLLPLYCKLAHRNGLKIYAWMTTRYADYGFSPDDSRYDRIFDLASREYVRDKGLDIWNPASERYLVALFRDLAKNPIDGILFQDDLVSRHTTGFGASSRERYETDFGVKLTPDQLYRGIYEAGNGRHYVREYTPGFWQWVDWKNRRILAVASMLSATVRRERPDARIALNFFYEAATSPRNALAWVSQSIERAEEGPFDYYAIMAYHRQMASELSLDGPKTADLLGRMTAGLYRRVGDQSRIMLKLQVRDWNTRERIPPEEFRPVLDAVLKNAAPGAGPPSIVFVPVDGAEDLSTAGGMLKSIVYNAGQ